MSGLKSQGYKSLFHIKNKVQKNFYLMKINFYNLNKKAFIYKFCCDLKKLIKY